MTAPAPVRQPTATARRWPDLLLVGAAHAGTAELRAALGLHPEVRFSDPAEPHHFSGIRPSRRFAREIPVVVDEPAYLALFAAMPAGAIAAEASTSYLWSPEAPARIAAANPGAAIVIVLRDPIERAWAHHRADQAAGVERRGFLRSIRDELARPGRWGQDQVYLGAGFYADAIERYRGAFAPHQLWIGFHESLIHDPRAAAGAIVSWLGRDADRMATTAAAPPDGRTRGSWRAALRGRSLSDPGPEPTMDASIRRLLAEVYADDVARLSEQLGSIPPWSITPAL